MKIAYVHVGADLRRGMGIARKIADQTGRWHVSGHDVRVFLQTYLDEGASERVLREAGIPVTVFVDEKVRAARMGCAAVKRIRTLRKLGAVVAEWRPTLVYLRYNFWYPALGRLAAAYPTVLEVNADDIAEYRLLLPWYKYVYHRLTRNKLLREAKSFVFMTEELASAATFNGVSAARTVIGNSIDLSRYPVLPAPRNERCRVVFIGEPGKPWHGLDKVMGLATAEPQWDFDIIGYGPESVRGAVGPNVTLHGYLTTQQYAPLMARADVGIGSLACHRKGMAEACPLKVREYLAFGMPVILGYRDTDFPGGAPFILSLPNTEANVRTSLRAIRAFVAAARGTRVPRTALHHIDVEAKEAQRLKFFHETLA